MAEGVTVCYREYGGGGGMMNDQGGTPTRLLPNGCLPGSGIRQLKGMWIHKRGRGLNN